MLREPLILMLGSDQGLQVVTCRSAKVLWALKYLLSTFLCSLGATSASTLPVYPTKFLNVVLTDTVVWALSLSYREKLKLREAVTQRNQSQQLVIYIWC